ANVANKRATVIGVVDALGGGTAQLDGLVCGGSGHIIGVDPITNFVYLPTGQYPVDPNATTTGQNGVAVFVDTSGPAQASVTSAQASLTAIAGSSASATVQFALVGRRMHLTASPTNLSSTAMGAWITVPT